jgi:hypothetical protein
MPGTLFLIGGLSKSNKESMCAQLYYMNEPIYAVTDIKNLVNEN